MSPEYYIFPQQRGVETLPVPIAQAHNGNRRPAAANINICGYSTVRHNQQQINTGQREEGGRRSKNGNNSVTGIPVLCSISHGNTIILKDNGQRLLKQSAIVTCWYYSHPLLSFCRSARFFYWFLWSNTESPLSCKLQETIFAHISCISRDKSCLNHILLKVLQCESTWHAYICNAEQLLATF